MTSHDKGFDPASMLSESKRCGSSSGGGGDGDGKGVMSSVKLDPTKGKQKVETIRDIYLRQLQLERTNKEIEKNKLTSLRMSEGRRRISRLCDCMNIKFDVSVIEKVVHTYALYLELALDTQTVGVVASKIMSSSSDSFVRVYPPHTDEHMKDLTLVTACFQDAETKEDEEKRDDDDHEKEKQGAIRKQIRSQKIDSRVYQIWLATVSLGCPQLIDALCATKTLYFREFEEDRTFNDELLNHRVLLYSQLVCAAFISRSSETLQTLLQLQSGPSRSGERTQYMCERTKSPFFFLFMYMGPNYNHTTPLFYSYLVEFLGCTVQLTGKAAEFTQTKRKNYTKNDENPEADFKSPFLSLFKRVGYSVDRMISSRTKALILDPLKKTSWNSYSSSSSSSVSSASLSLSSSRSSLSSSSSCSSFGFQTELNKYMNASLQRIYSHVNDFAILELLYPIRLQQGRRLLYRTSKTYRFTLQALARYCLSCMGGGSFSGIDFVLAAYLT